MLQFFRKSFGSKIGAAVALGFLFLIALAFAGGDIANTGFSGTGGGGDRAATVGSERVGTSEIERAASRAVETLRREQPTINMRSFIASGGFEQVVTNAIDLVAIREFGRKYGVIIGDRLIDSEIAKLPSVQGPDGKVSNELYQAFLQQNQLTDKQLRGELRQSLAARQLLTNADLGIAVPQDLTVRYAAVITERRSGVIGLLPSAVFAPKAAPSDTELAKWYAANSREFVRPERRTIRYATFTDAALKSVPAPTEAEIAARYNANKAQYAASESRGVSQLVLPTEAAAKAALAEAGGKSLETVAAGKGLSVAKLAPQTRAALTTQSSKAVADAAFAAERGRIVGPLRAPIGWILLRVDAVETKAARSLDQARAEIVPALTAEKRRTALTDFSAQIEDEFNNGSTLSDVAKTLGLTLSETPPLLANGQVYGQQGATAPAVIAKVLPTAFLMESENQPQLAEVEPGKQFIVFDVAQIAAEAAPPLAEVKTQAIAEYQLDKGAEVARATAKKLEAAVKKGQDLGAAMSALGLPLPPVDRVDLPREQVQAMGQKTPPPLAMLFALAKGQVKLLAAPRSRGWYVVKVNEVIPGKVERADPRLAPFRQTLAQVTAQEYSQQLRAAMRADVGVKRNEDALKAIKTRLSGGN